MRNYSKAIECGMLRFYLNLNEKDQRYYSAIEALKLGHGGVTYISELFGCTRKTIYSGIRELASEDLVENGRVRRKGGGRIAIEDKLSNLDETFLQVVDSHIAGDPMNQNIRWIKISNDEIRKGMKKHGIEISRNIIKKLLKKHKFVKRKIQRKTKTGKSKDREQQFNIISRKRKKFERSNNPIISFDTKKKEDLGNLHRAGEIYCTEAPESYDHDYPHLSKGKIVPHGIYDVKQNQGYINIGVDNETAEFICDSIKIWWNRVGEKAYPEANEILAFCDAGGANSYRHHIFKLELQKLVNCINIPIRISHYPPYTSKWNLIEHRLFPHVTRAMSGMMINTVEEAKDMISRTNTKTGLKVKVNIIRRLYEKGKRVAKNLIEKINIKRDKNLGYLNYIISPQAI